MTLPKPDSGPPTREEEIASLVSRLRETEERLSELIGEQVDSVLDSRGRSFLLRHAQESLRRSEERFRALIENSFDAIALLSPEGGVVHVSPAVTRILGYEVSEILGRSGLEWVHPEDRARVAALLAETWNQARKPSTTEVRLRHRDGSWRWIEGIAQPLRNQAHSSGIVCNFRDISERREAERELRASEERFRLLSVATTDVVWDLDMVCDQMCWGEGLEAIFGWRPSDLAIGGSWVNQIHPDDRPRVTAQLERLVKRNSATWSDEFRWRRKNGDYAFVRDSGSIIRDEHGKPRRMVGGIVDLTRRRATEEKIVQQAALLDKARDAIVVRDLAHRITYWNKSAERVYGWTADEVMGRSAKEMAYFDAAPFERAMKTLMERGEFTGEMLQSTKDGRTLTVEVRWTLVQDDGGDRKSVLAINTDITERKKLEDQVLRGQRMESIGTLAGGIAHDLNNVLAPILMGAELLKTLHDDEESQQLICSIESSTQRGRELVKQVLSFARGVTGNRGTVEMAEIFSEIESIIRNTFPKNIVLEVNLEPDVWLMDADSTQINQIMLNLCVNARDAMPNGGQLRIRAMNVMVGKGGAAGQSDLKPGPYVEIRVEDEGSGMFKRIRDRIFEPFFTTKEVGKGTGLGLPTVLGIVRSHGGSIDVESEPGKGSKFRIHLPGQTEAAHSNPPALRPSRRGNGELILVVDDEVAILVMAKQVLQSFGYSVMIADSGEKALALFSANLEETALVVTDMMMPGMDGLTLADKLRAIKPDLQIIAASGLYDTGSVAKAKGAGITSFLPKPYTAHMLLRLVAASVSQGTSSAG